MSVEEIPSDETVEMSELFHRAFNAAGCDPMCHCCEKMIPKGSLFKLATVRDLLPVCWDKEVWNPNSIHYGEEDNKTSTELQARFGESHEVMLCDVCTSEDYKLKEIKEYESEVKRIVAPKGGCRRINGKIVH